MSVYLNKTDIQITYYLKKDFAYFCAGLITTSLVTNYIAYTLSSVNKTILCTASAASFTILSRTNPGLCAATALIVSSIFWYMRRVPVTLTPEEFKTLLIHQYPIPFHVIVKGDLNLSTMNIQSLPDTLEVEGSLIVADCKYLKSLPRRLKVKENLIAYRCYNLEQWPQVIEVGGHVNLAGCSLLKRLSDNLRIRRSLDLTCCFALELPRRLHVHGRLYLNHQPALSSLPNDLQVDQLIFIGGCPKLHTVSPRLHPKLRSFSIPQNPCLHPLILKLSDGS